jgi:AcrR family transcriptional regulator
LALGEDDGLNKISAIAWDSLTDEVAQRWSASDQPAKQDRSRRRQQDILDAAVIVFARDGIARARIADVAAQAEVPLSSVYDYYPSKEDLAYAIPAKRMGAFYAEFLDRARLVATARERLRLYLWLTADFARRNPEWARILYLEIWPSVMIKEVNVRRCIDDFARILIALVRDGERTREWEAGPDAYQTAAIFIGSINQLLITWLLYGRPRSLGPAVSALIDRLLPLLGKPPAGQPTLKGRVARRGAPPADGASAVN